MFIDRYIYDVSENIRPFLNKSVKSDDDCNKLNENEKKNYFTFVFLFSYDINNPNFTYIVHVMKNLFFTIFVSARRNY